MYVSIKKIEFIPGIIIANIDKDKEMLSKFDLRPVGFHNHAILFYRYNGKIWFISPNRTSMELTEKYYNSIKTEELKQAIDELVDEVNLSDLFSAAFINNAYTNADARDINLRRVSHLIIYDQFKGSLEYEDILVIYQDLSKELQDLIDNEKENCHKSDIKYNPLNPERKVYSFVSSLSKFVKDVSSDFEEFFLMIKDNWEENPLYGHVKPDFLQMGLKGVTSIYDRNVIGTYVEEVDGSIENMLPFNTPIPITQFDTSMQGYTYTPATIEDCEYVHKLMNSDFGVPEYALKNTMTTLIKKGEYDKCLELFPVPIIAGCCNYNIWAGYDNHYMRMLQGLIIHSRELFDHLNEIRYLHSVAMVNLATQDLSSENGEYIANKLACNEILTVRRNLAVNETVPEAIREALLKEEAIREEVDSLNEILNLIEEVAK